MALSIINKTSAVYSGGPITSITLGSGTPGRKLFICALGALASTATDDITALSIGGNAPTPVSGARMAYGSAALGGQGYLAKWYVLEDDSTSGSAAVSSTVTGTGSTLYALLVWEITGAASSPVGAIQTKGAGGTDQTLSITTTAANSLILHGLSGITSPGTPAAGFAEDFDLTVGATALWGGSRTAATATSYTVGATIAALSGFEQGAGVAIEALEGASGGGALVEPPAVNVTVGAPAPAVVGGRSAAVSVPVVAVVVQAVAPAVAGNQSASIQPPASNVVVSAPVPAVIGRRAAAITIPAASVVVAAPIPQVRGNVNAAITVPAVPVSVGAPVPVVAGKQSASIAPPAADIAVAAPVPAISAGQGVNILAPASEIIVSVPAPAVTGHRAAEISVPTVDIAVLAPVPAVAGNQSVLILPPVADIEAQALAPVVEGARGGSVEVPEVALLVQALAPVIAINGWAGQGAGGTWNEQSDGGVWTIQPDNGTWTKQ